MQKPDVSVVITAHREGVIAGVSARSAWAAVEHAEKCDGLKSEIIVVLDRADDTTREVMRAGFGDGAIFLETSEGDPGQARNKGIEAASGAHAAFLDADDLWSYNWLSEACHLLRARPDVIAHSACNVIFGEEHLLWWHPDSEGDLCDPVYLNWNNYWDAMSFARTETYRRFPFKANDLELGFGHEDWHWSAWTLAEGVPHKPVPNTLHFKRKRRGSQMDVVERSGAIVWPLDL